MSDKREDSEIQIDWTSRLAAVILSAVAVPACGAFLISVFCRIIGIQWSGIAPCLIGLEVIGIVMGMLFPRRMIPVCIVILLVLGLWGVTTIGRAYGNPG
jgi:hypothetical protein